LDFGHGSGVLGEISENLPMAIEAFSVQAAWLAGGKGFGTGAIGWGCQAAWFPGRKLWRVGIIKKL
jgi:hypothetical protein